MGVIDQWVLGTKGFVNGWQPADRAADTDWFISEKPSSIILVRDGVALSSQVVRIETSSGPTVDSGSNMVRASTECLIVGYLDHPTIADTNIQRGDRFKFDGKDFDVLDVLVNIPFRVEATATART